MSTSLWTDKQTVIYPYSGILVRNKREEITDKYNINESQKHYAKCKKQDTNEHMLYEPMLWNSRKFNLIYVTKCRLVVARSGKRG